MIANFFQNLDRQGVEALLISGQATVLYGAATFSEDIDLWINPTEVNRVRFLDALHKVRARYYKLTPPFTVEHLQGGHGFHFVLPGGADGDIFLDVMGQPPRAGSFSSAAVTARKMETEWGVIPTIGIQPLVELKKTQRLEDYPIISKLALAWFDQPECTRTQADYLWALRNIFTLPELALFFTEHPAAVADAAAELNPDVGEFGRQAQAGGEVPENIERRVGEYFQTRIAELLSADRLHWRDIIARLKTLRAMGTLMSENEPVLPDN